MAPDPAPRQRAVRVERDVPMETRDGVVLRSDICRPDDDLQYPVLLGRTPYGKSSWGGWIDPLRTAAEGYAVVVNDMRGGFASEGEFRPFFHDIDDGYDVVEWCARQPWSNGRVGMFGSSAPGFMQLLAAAAKPPHLVAIAPMQTWSSFGRGCVYDPGGAFLLYTQQWALLLSSIDPERRLDAAIEGYAARRELVARGQWDPGWGWSQLPVGDFSALNPEQSAFYHEWLDHPDHDEFWHPLDLEPRYADIEVPALHLVGLYDKFRFGSVRNWTGLRAEGATALARDHQHLVLGPWTHGIPVRAQGSEEFCGIEAEVDVRALVLRWYDHWLKDLDTGIRDEPPVSVFVPGEDQWHQVAAWPPPTARPAELFLRSDGELTSEPPRDEAPDHYRHDPAASVPTVPGRMSRSEGPVDLRSLESRADMLSYTSAELEEDLTVIGPVTARLWASTTAADADWIVTLIDVFPDGRAQRVTEGMIRGRYRESQERPTAVPAGEPTAYDIELAPTSRMFRRGHRIRIGVASTSFPQYDRNAGRGVAFDPGLEGAEATQVVFHDATRPSSVTLCVS